MKSAVVIILLLFYPFGPNRSVARQDTIKQYGWDNELVLLKKILPPVFPDKVFNVIDYGARGDGKTDCSEAFRKAIESCNSSGGGMVFVPKGIFLTGAICLKSNINLHISKEAIIRFETDPKKYLPIVYTRWEGVECMNYSSLIYAFKEENIAVTGDGILDGQGSIESWWSWKGKKETGWKAGMPDQDSARNKLFEMGEKGVPVAERRFGEGYYLRPNFFAPYKCKNILVEGVTFKNSPMWFLNPVLCTNVSIIGVTIDGPGPNNDGCDPESCSDILIKDCIFNTGDDCVAIKSGRNADGRRVNVPCENILVQGCIMKNGHGGITIGSEMSGGVRNVFIENCTMDSPNLDIMFRIKTNATRGGFIENVFLRNIKIGQVAEAVFKIDYYYEEGDKGRFTPVVRNIDIEKILSDKSKYVIWIKAYDRSPVTDLSIKNCIFNNVGQANVIENVKNLSLINVAINRKQ